MTVAARPVRPPRVAARHFPSSSEEGSLRAFAQKSNLWNYAFVEMTTKSLGESIRIPPRTEESADNCLHRAGRLDSREALIEALILVSESLVIDPEQVKQRGLEVTDMHGVLDDVV